MKVFFTADHHFGHTNIIKYCNRPFNNIKEMDNVLIYNYNLLVRPEDTVFFLGDFAMNNSENYVSHMTSRLNGQKHLILGNHDRMRAKAYLRSGFLTVHTHFWMHFPSLGEVFMVHDPAESAVDRSKLWLCGHVHDLFLQQKNAFNVGVDVHDFKPITIEQIKEKLIREGLKCQ